MDVIVNHCFRSPVTMTVFSSLRGVLSARNIIQTQVSKYTKNDYLILNKKQKKVIKIYILFTMQSCGLTCCCCPQVRNGGHYSVPARPSRWMWDKFKDDVHFYFMLVTSSLTLDDEDM